MLHHQLDCRLELALTKDAPLEDEYYVPVDAPLEFRPVLRERFNGWRGYHANPSGHSGASRSEYRGRHQAYGVESTWPSEVAPVPSLRRLGTRRRAHPARAGISPCGLPCAP